MTKFSANKRFIVALVAACMLPIAAMAGFVGIARSDFQPAHYSRQDQPLWCWASSAAMVMSYQGVRIPQSEIVAHIKGAAVNAAAQPLEMINSVNNVFTRTVDGVPSYVVMSGQYVNGAPLAVVLYNQLKQKRPVILNYLVPQTPWQQAYGHAVVVTGIDAEFINNNLRVNTIHVFDPFAYRQTPYGLEPDDSKIYQEHRLQLVSSGPFTPPILTIPVGQITGVILMNSSTVPK